MQPQILQQLNGNGQQNNIAQIKQMMKAAQAASNPKAFLNKTLSENPQLKAIYQASNGDLKSAFYAFAKNRGVDPESILSQLR